MRFHLPGGDGFVVSLAGGWVLVLLIWRLFDKPEVSGATATVGIDWGIFVALLAAGTLVAAGARMRAAGRPEPANPIAEEPEWEVPERRPASAANGRPREHTEVTQVLRERPPSWEGEAPEPPGRAERPRDEPDDPDEPPESGPPGPARTACSERPRRGGSEQLFAVAARWSVGMRRVLLALAVLVVLPASTKRRRRGRRRGTSRGPTCSSTACGPAAG